MSGSVNGLAHESMAAGSLPLIGIETQPAAIFFNMLYLAGVAATGGACVGANPARISPRFTSGACMKYCHTKPLRKFSVIKKVIPTSIPTTSVDTQSTFGLNASANP